MGRDKKALIFGAAGRVGLGLTATLLRNQIDVVAVDSVDEVLLSQRLARTLIDNRIASGSSHARVSAYGNFDVLDEGLVTELLAREKPDVVVNYAIPFTWDAAKQLDNYERISRAGLGAFSAVQALAPRVVACAIAKSGISALFIVGNLPDITIPVIYGTKNSRELALPVCGAGNVGLIEAGIRHQLSLERNLSPDDLEISLVAHHVHWVAPREPGYSNSAPFMLKIRCGEKDITDELGDLRALMNRSIANSYEPGAGFSSTTSELAAQSILALLGDRPCLLHVPAPNGLPGGYPAILQRGSVQLNLPIEWQKMETIETMLQAHKYDGIERIAPDGTIHFHPESVDILQKEMGFSLPLVVPPSDLESVAREQIAAAFSLVKARAA